MQNAECPDAGVRLLPWVLAAGLGVLLAVHVPAFLCLPPDNDVVLFDLCAREVFAGGALYRDAFENNLPGMLWWQSAVRTVLGWRSEAIRVADLLIVGGCVWLLARWAPEGRLGVGLVLTAFYLSTSEWCHAQRDVWMLLPVLLAVRWRRRQVESAFSFTRAVGEGLLWGIAVWIKPFVLLPALACFLAVRPPFRRQALADVIGLLLGGLLAGAGGLAWLAACGSWADFWDVQLVWNREYASHDYSAGQRGLVWAGLFIRFFPWLLLHVAAVPIAVGWLAQREPTHRRLLAALYLGWLAQVVLLQHTWDYLHVPPLLLALTVVAQEAARSATAKRLALGTFLAICLIVRLLPLTADRLSTWADCLREGSTARLRDRLSLLGKVRWQDLESVRDFLRGEGVADGELTCLNMHAMPLLLDLEVRPATRFLVLQNVLVVFARQRPRVFAELADSRQRFLVLDVNWTAWKGKTPPQTDDRVVFAAGPYRVLALTGGETADWAREHLELPHEPRTK
jgi:hypothetical protein